jgi:hypothetical protein
MHLCRGGSLFNENSVEIAHGITAGSLENIREKTVKYRLDSANDHCPAEPRGNAEMLPVGLTHSLGMIEKDAADHCGFSI